MNQITLRLTKPSDQTKKTSAAPKVGTQRDRRNEVKAEPAAHASARPAELLFDMTVGGRLRRELVERCMEETLGLFASTLTAVDKAEVGDHESLVLLVPELP
jgi:hypothetical protein